MAEHPLIKALRWPLALTRLGLLAEQIWRAFWPFFSLTVLLLAYVMLGLPDLMMIEVTWAVAVLGLIGLAGLLVRGIRQVHWPSRDQALSRLDDTLPGQPIRASLDDQAIGADDPASAAVWQAHQARMQARAATARAPSPDLTLSQRDPYALRYVAAVGFAVALIFGSLWRVGDVGDLAPGTPALAGGPAWEGWVEPPRHTGLPTLYLADTPEGAMQIPQGSRVSLRFYGQVGALTLSETVSGRAGDLPPASQPEQEFQVQQDGTLQIDGPGGRSWQVSLIPDAPPTVTIAGQAESSAAGPMSLPFAASDDYGIEVGQARIALDLPAVDRRHGLTVDPDPRDGVTVPLPLPISGDRSEFTEDLIEDFSDHPWANLPVVVTLTVTDAAGQAGASEPMQMLLPGRRFFDPLAAAVIEQRRDLLWARGNADRVAMLLRAISHRPEDLFRSDTAYLRLRVTLRRLETFADFGLSVEAQEEIAQSLWDLAILLEEGDLSDALERLRRAQERLTEAMKNGASDQEIAELMQELRRATDEYMRQLSRQAQQEQEGDQPAGDNTMQMTQNDLQRMMDRIQELMEQGRMAEAQQALQELQELMENMRVTQGQQGPGQQAMEGLAETLRDQQGLSDQAFRDLQEQFNPGARSGESQGNEGRNGGEGRGQSHEGQGGQNPGDQGQGGEGSLADRQQALRDALRRQQNNLPGQGTAEGDAAREALDRAGRAMDQAEDALRDDDLARAIDRQAEAMNALRDGIQSLGEALAQQQPAQQPGQGSAQGDPRGPNTDPLGRNQSLSGANQGGQTGLQDEDVYRRARDLLDEIRRRAGEAERPQDERDYLKRLLDRF